MAKEQTSAQTERSSHLQRSNTQLIGIGNHTVSLEAQINSKLNDKKEPYHYISIV